MAMGYQGYQGFTLDPEVEALRRKRAVADALQAQSGDASPTTAVGGLARIADALIGRYAGQNATTAETAYSDKQKQVADALVNTALPQDTPAPNPPSASIGPDIPADTSGGDPSSPSYEGGLGASPQANPVQQPPTASSKINDVARSLYAYTKDPMSAINYAQAAKAAQAPEYEFLGDPEKGVYLGNKRDGTGQVMAAPNKASTTTPSYTVHDTAKGLIAVNDKDPTDVKPLGYMGKTGDAAKWRPATASEIAAQRLPSTSSGQINENTGEFKANPPGNEMTNENQFRAQYENETRPFVTVRDAYARMKDQYKLQQDQGGKSPAADMSMIYSFMKINDPGSTVREGEYATAQNATGVPARVTNIYNSLVNGNRLNPAQRDNFLASAKSLYKSQESTFTPMLNFYRDRAKNLSLDPNVIPDFRLPPEPTQPTGAAPAPAPAAPTADNPFSPSYAEQAPAAQSSPAIPAPAPMRAVGQAPTTPNPGHGPAPTASGTDHLAGQTRPGPDGKTYRFSGGNWNDPKSWQVVQ